MELRFIFGKLNRVNMLAMLPSVALQGNYTYTMLPPDVFYRYILPPEISQKRLKNDLIFSITVSLF